MKDASSDFAVAMLRGEQVVGHRLYHDWDIDDIDERIDNVTKFVSSVEVTQELTSQLPAQTRIIEGGTAAELSATLERGNINWYGSNIEYKAATTNSSGSTTSSSATITRPTSVVGDIIIVFVAGVGSSVLNMSELPIDHWFTFLIRGDQVSATRLEGYGFMRRVNEDEENTYTFPLEFSTAWAASAFSIGDPGAAGLCAFINEGQNDDTSATFTLYELPEYEIPQSGCVVLSGFAAAVAVTGASWTPTDDTELVDISTSRGASALNVVMGVQLATDVDAGRYTKSSTLSTTGTVNVGFSLAFAPFLAGNELQHAAWTFSELNANGPYIGKVRTYRKMLWDIGLITDSGVEYVRMFTGRSLATDGSSRGRNHVITALDERETMRSPTVSLPTNLAENPFISSGETVPNLPGLELTWVVSLLFQQARVSTSFSSINLPEDRGYLWGYGFFAAPNVRRSTLMHVPCHGSLHTFFTNMTCQYAFTVTSGLLRRRVMFWDGLYVAATEQAPHNGGSIQALWDGLNVGGFGDVWLWSTVDQTAGRIEFVARFFVESAGGSIVLTVQGDTAIHFVKVTITQDGSVVWDLRQNGGATRTSTGPSVPTDEDWHWYGVYWNSTTGQVIFAIDGVETANSVSVLSNNANTDSFIEMTLVMQNGAQISDIYVDGGINETSSDTSTTLITATSDWFADSFTPNAFIDKSDTLLDGILFIDGSLDPWEILQDLAQSDFAAVYLDSFGQMHWRNGRSDASDEGQTIVRELTARDALLDVDYTSGASQIANVVSVSYTPIEIIIDGDYYRPAGAIKVPASSTLTITFEAPGPLVPSAPFSATLTAANTQADGSGTDLNINFILVSSSFGSQFGSVSFENQYAQDVWLVDTSGQPAFVLIASWFQQSANAEPVTSTDDNSIRKYRVQPLSIGSTVWRQREDAAEMLAEQLVGDLSTPRPIVRNVRIIGDPRLELGDLTTLNDENGIGLNGSYRLSGISSRYSASSGFGQTITAREGPETADWDEDSWDSDEIWG